VGDIAYVELEDNNGGIVLNISEGGLSLTAAGVMAVDHPPRVRVQLPRSRDWIELPAEIAWVSESKKEAGLRFQNLTPEIDAQIRNWISSEASPAEIPWDNGRYSRKLAPPPSKTDRREPTPSVLATAKSPETVPDETQISSLISASAEPEIALREGALPVALQAPGAAAEKSEGSESPRTAMERRLHARRRIKSLIYVELGKSNCGVMVNMSETGVQIEAAVALVGDRIPRMRFQLPNSRKWIESNGKVIWISESRREIGIQFIDLPADERASIMDWVSQPGSTVEPPAPRETARRKHELSSKASISQQAGNRDPGVVEPDKTARTVEQSPVSSSSLAGSSLSLKLAGASGPSIKFPAAGDDAAHKSLRNRVSVWLNSGLVFRGWRTLAAPIVLVLMLAFGIGWFMAWQRAGDEATRSIAPTTEVASDLPQPAEPPAAVPDSHPSSTTVAGAPSQSHGQSPTSVNKNANVPALAADSEARGAVRPSTNSASNALNHAPESAKSPAHPPERQAPRSTANFPVPSASVAPAPALGNSATRSSPSVRASPTPIPDHSTAASIPAKEKPSVPPPPPAKPAEIPAIPAGSVSISVPAFPSIRVPPELKSQASRLGMSMQIGQLMTRVEPVYPEELRRQGIEGTVKLHVTVGREGAVQTIGLLSGPPLLSPLAIAAVRKWQFKPTVLGGQPVETEEDITVVFRIANPTLKSN
jgi:TonB family protein